MITVLGGIAAYAIQKAIDRRNTIASMRRDFYSEFLDTWLARHIGQSTPETESHYSRLRLRLYVISSDQVIRSFYEVSDFLNRAGTRALTSGEAAVVRKLLAKMILEIRKDCYEKSHLNLEEVANFMPIAGKD